MSPGTPKGRFAARAEWALDVFVRRLFFVGVGMAIMGIWLTHGIGGLWMQIRVMSKSDPAKETTRSRFRQAQKPRKNTLTSHPDSYYVSAAPLFGFCSR